MSRNTNSANGFGGAEPPAQAAVPTPLLLSAAEHDALAASFHDVWVSQSVFREQNAAPQLAAAMPCVAPSASATLY